MSRHPNDAEDRETRATLRALRRAARRAQELGARTGTPVYVIRDLRIVDLTNLSDRNGRTYKSLGLRPDQLMVLRYEPDSDFRESVAV